LVTYQVVDHQGGPLHIGLLSPQPPEEETLQSVIAYRIAAPPVPSLRGEPSSVTYPAALLKCRNASGEQCVPGKP
ncbi:MAG TPA: hypothetical protein PLD86_05825, partial [Vicinamibacteria bacterium]|nr:hypothetical protein [Vicinamibacteria bacterium]